MLLKVFTIEYIHLYTTMYIHICTEEVQENKMETKQKLKREHFKEKYDFICCNCGYEQWAKPSMMMTELGKNSGHGSCLKCEAFLHLEIIPDLFGEEMKAEIWDKWLKKNKKIKNEKRNNKCFNGT